MLSMLSLCILVLVSHRLSAREWKETGRFMFVRVLPARLREFATGQPAHVLGVKKDTLTAQLVVLFVARVCSG